MSDLADLDSARWFAALARDLAEQADRGATASRVLELITGATGCSFAAIAHLSPQGVLIHNHATDRSLIGKVAAISVSTGEGIAWQALRQRATVRVDDLDSESRW
ncbi:GAF domain-containing protein, partial [Jatrophihabitans sp.]|uniref:GAF domain-containing protein n=1 Tax=Jatrophihabitans sp. TaxID=1932789 RepID=UPI002F00424A